MTNQTNRFSNRSARRLFGLLAAAVVSASASSAFAVQPPDGIYAGFGNLTNTSFAEYGVLQEGVDFFGVEESVQGTIGPVSLTENPIFGSDDNGFFGVQGTASASSVNGILRASAFATVTDNSVNSDGFNTPYLVDDTSDPDGIPSDLDFSAYAGFTDRLQFGGTATGYTSRYLIRVTGEITGPNSFVAIDIRNGDGATETYFYDQVGQINDVIATNSVAVSGSQQEFGITVQTTTTFSPAFDGPGNSSGALFSSTLEVIGLEVRDEVGQLVSTGFVTTSGGATPTITAVPEPTTAGLLAAAGLLMAGRRRRG